MTAHVDQVDERAMVLRRTSARATINDVAVALPSDVLTDEEFRQELGEIRHELLRSLTGVFNRHIARPTQTALDLGEEACRTLFAAHPDLAARIDTLIFCTQSPDHILPPNACILHGRLDLPTSVAAFDLPHACSAFVYALHLTQALIVSGAAANVLIVTADTYSKYAHPLDRATRALFGDGAAATWVGATSDGRGVLDVVCGTDGKGFDKFFIPAGGCRLPTSDRLRNEAVRDGSGNSRSPANIHMSGSSILAFTRNRIPPHVEDVLARNGLTVDDLDWIVFHQASGVVLETLTGMLRADPTKVVRNIENVGNLVSSSIPTALRSAMDDDLMRTGQLVLLCGFGAGLSWGSALMRW